MNQIHQTDVSDFAAPWEEFPKIPRFSMGWRMGDAEEFLMKWHQQYSTLKKWERRAYRRRHRRPFPLWLGIYSLGSKNRLIYVLGALGTIAAYFLLFTLRIVVGPFAADRINLD